MTMKALQYPPVEGMAKAYPELRSLHDYYMAEGFGDKEADQLLRYMSVLCDARTPEKTIKGRERLAAKELTNVMLGKVEKAKSAAVDIDGNLVPGRYAAWVSSWFKVVYNARLATWFSMKTALMHQSEYLMQPIDPDGDIDKQADGRKKVADKIDSMLQRVEALETDLFASVELKKVVNEELVRHQFAGYPELFALTRRE